MTERNQKIIARVRAKLKEIGLSNIQNDDIYDVASMVVNDMLQDMKCKQLERKIYTKTGISSYNLGAKLILPVKELFISWTGSDLVYETNWKAVQGLTGSYPLYYHIFAEKIHFAPTPANNNDIITIWGYQSEESNPMDDNTEPETPRKIDNVLVLGICAEFDSKFKEEYEFEKNRKSLLFRSTITANKTNKPTW